MNILSVLPIALALVALPAQATDRFQRWPQASFTEAPRRRVPPR